MPERPPDYHTLLPTLEQHGVRYVLIGGLALVAHGASTVTQDIDLCYERGQGNREALATALAPFQPRLRGVPDDLPFRFDARTLRSASNFTLRTHLGDVDLLGDVPGVNSFDELWARSELLILGGVSVRVASLEDLIAMKRAAGRPKDIIHIAELEALMRLKLERGNS